MIDIVRGLRRIAEEGYRFAGDAADEIERLRARLEEAEAECFEQARLNGMGSEREALLMAKLEAAERKCDVEQRRARDLQMQCCDLIAEVDALRAKIAEMEKQEPVAEIVSFGGPDLKEVAWEKGKMPALGSKLYALPGAQAQPAPSFADAYQGAMEEVAIWKKRALEAEGLNRKFLADVNSPMYMGEPAQPAPSVPTALLVAVADLVAQMEIVARVGFVDAPDDKDSCAAFCVAEGTWLELMSCVESLALALAAAAPEAKP